MNEMMTNETRDNAINIHIKRNIFGQKSWTLNVNADETTTKRKQTRIIGRRKLICVVLFVIFLLVAICIIFTLFYVSIRKPPHVSTFPSIAPLPRFFLVFDQRDLNVERVLERVKETRKRVEVVKRTNLEVGRVCECNFEEEVCLRRIEGQPECVLMMDRRDPSGCGGVCRINTQYCRLLDRDVRVYECVDNHASLRCPFRYFSCANDALCVHETRRCDGYADCPQMDDERNCQCNLETHFHCGANTSCLLQSKRCDRVVDCWDMSDEKGCNH